VLRRLGWQVISFWETDIKRNPEQAALAVKIAVAGRLKAAPPAGATAVGRRARAARPQAARHARA
jgi:G:T-mismatch repair DNA endonuclease (very short patch repair protein)